MPVVPVLMVLYTNDAVEVRYSDGSCLKMAPCGSTFVHHQSPGETIHPAHGMKVISQRCQFVTSDYRQKVLEALDYRNRFAERPYVCPDLLHQDQLMPLYADVRSVAWPSSLDKATYEYLPDGSVRLVSEDEYSSMVLSTHRQDFTVCYLSKVSRDRSKVKIKHKFKARSMAANSKGHPGENSSKQDSFESSHGEEKHTIPSNILDSDDYNYARIMRQDVNYEKFNEVNLERESFKHDRPSPDKICSGGPQVEKAIASVTKSDAKESNKSPRTNEGHTEILRTDNTHARSSQGHEGQMIDTGVQTSKDSSPGGSGSPLCDDELCRKLADDISISPISVVSGLRSEKSSPCTEEDYRRFSTPTYMQADAPGVGLQKMVLDKSAAFRQYKREQQMADGSFLDYPPAKNKNEAEDVDSALDETLMSHNVSNTQNSQRTDNNFGVGPKNTSSEPQNLSLDKTINNPGKSPNSFENPKYVENKISKDSSPHSQSTERRTHLWVEPTQRSQSAIRETVSWEECSPESQSGERDAGSWEESPESRVYYTWVTRHYSCEECPVVWRHSVNLARAVMDNRETLEQKALKLSSNPKKKQKDPRSIRRDKCVLSQVPRPLPLSCEGQHLHSLGGRDLYDNERDLEENLAIFRQGKLKVLLIEGVVFRLVRLATTKVVEIFPGDGSVLTSQGLSGHFFKHIIPRGHDKVEERTYSLKSAPPTPPKAAYSIEKLIKRAHRFLLQASQEDKMITNADVCCWKYVEKRLEILPTTLLEDCCVPGHGKFSAHSNGHVRILFDDRTSLEMTCDFSKRVNSCLQHSDGASLDDTQRERDENQSILVTKQSLTTKQTGLCKLLLPNGQYQIVDINLPGVYKRYTDAALEWQAWVNSSPGQRKDFYDKWDKQDTHEVLAAKEIQKIKCFNYIVDSTVGKQISPSSQHGVAMVTDISPKGNDRVQYFNEPNVQNFSIPQRGNVFSDGHVTSEWHSGNFPRGQGHQSYRQGQGHGNYGILPGNGAYVQGHHHHSVGHSGTYPQDQYRHGYSIPPGGVVTSGIPGLHRETGSRTRDLTHLHKGPSTNLETLQGFNAVREALLKTSKAIHDIDNILDKKSGL